jgi:hypothetical protein
MARFYPARRILPSMLAPFRPVRRTAIAPNRPAVMGRLLQPRGQKSALVGAGREVRTGNALRTLLLETVASVALLCLSDARALADCAPANPGPGGTVTCSDTDNDGFTAPLNTPVTIDVLSGASVGGSGINVSGTGDSFVDNDGTISGPSSVVFNGVAGFSKTLNNNGMLNAGIVGSGDGIIVINHNGVINSGGITITGNGENRLNIFAGRTVNGLADITGARNFVDSQARERSTPV